MVLLFNQYVCDICEPPTVSKKPTRSATTVKQAISVHPRTDNALYLLCGKCGRRCTTLVNHRIFCSKRHATDAGYIEVGDRLECSQIGNGIKDMFFDGFSWIDVP